MKSDEIKSWRLSRKMSRHQLGELCGVDYATVANWELGRNTPKGLTLQRLTDVMAGVSTTNLTAAEEALLERVLKEGGYKSREQFFADALVRLITKSS